MNTSIKPTRDAQYSLILVSEVLFNVGYKTVDIADVAAVTRDSKLYANAYFAYTVVSNNTRTNCRSSERISNPLSYAPIEENY